MKILRLIASVDARDGGPIANARLMAAEHAKRGHETEFVTLDRPDALEVSNFPFHVHATGQGRFFRPFGRTIARIAPRFDVAVIHGLWNHASIGGLRALAAAGLPWVTFPHGMLDPYFRSTKPLKHWVKQGYWTFWQGRALSQAHAVLFTSAEEQRRAENAFWGQQRYNGKVVAYCAKEMGEGGVQGWADFSARVPDLGNRNYLLFLSRIHPKKACDQLLEASAKVLGNNPALDLVMAGPDQTGWQAELREMTTRLGIGDRVHWPGMIEGAAKQAAFRRAHAFVLPSHQENFGQVVAEALSAGTPVLISDKVNIWREIKEAGAGLVSPDTVAGTTQMLQDFLRLTDGDHAKLRAAARPCYDKNFSVSAAASDLEAVLQDAAKSRLGPSSGFSAMRVSGLS